MMKRSAIKTDLFADQCHTQTLDELGDAPRPVSSQGEPAAVSHRTVHGRMPAPDYERRSGWP